VKNSISRPGREGWGVRLHRGATDRAMGVVPSFGGDEKCKESFGKNDPKGNEIKGKLGKKTPREPFFGQMLRGGVCLKKIGGPGGNPTRRREGLHK